MNTLTMLRPLPILVLLSLTAYAVKAAPSEDWWKTTAFYQIYPRSFKDSDGDGVGDLNGIASQLEHLVDAGVGAFWISPIYKSPMADFGYDIADFKAIDPIFGTMADFENLVAKAKQLGLKVIMDFVPNHSSNEHEWFKKSIKRIEPYDDYYIWRDGKIVNGTRVPPNNWLSVFKGSAWEWNEERGQYYFHQFVAGQPDLNYRNANLDQEMKDVLTFWLEKGVEGFRIDAINFMFERYDLPDEPLSGTPGVLPDDSAYLKHIYTQDLHETYLVLLSWRKLLDDFSERTGTDSKVIMSEAYTTQPLALKYFEYGSSVPFNFMFISDLRNASTAADFKQTISNWIANVPANSVANWVVGNHDQSRVASRFGTRKADQFTMLATILPGISVFYNGDEIGMVDKWLSYEETVDPSGCNAGPNRYESSSRDPQRTPFQWDNSTSAGFSSSNTTWLPVNENYKTLNLAAQKAASVSHYHVFQALTKLRQTPAIRNGSVAVELVNDKVLAVVREVQGSDLVILLINFDNSTQVVDVKAGLGLLYQNLTTYTASVPSSLVIGSTVNTANLQLPAEASVVLTTQQTFDSFSSS